MAITFVTPTDDIRKGLRVGGSLAPVNLKFTSDGGSAATIQLGFNPSRIQLIDETNLAKYEWDDSMGNGVAFKQITAGTYSKVTSNGISVANGVVTLGTSILAAATYYIRLIP